MRNDPRCHCHCAFFMKLYNTNTRCPGPVYRGRGAEGLDPQGGVLRPRLRVQHHPRHRLQLRDARAGVPARDHEDHHQVQRGPVDTRLPGEQAF